MTAPTTTPAGHRPGGAGGLAAIEHVVVLMLENRSFDHMLGYLYADSGNVSPAGQPFEGLTGTESNPDASGNPVGVYQITPATPNAYFMPGADPGEGYKATNTQLWGSATAPASRHAGRHDRVRHRLRVHDHVGDQREVVDRGRHHGQLDHGLLHPAGPAGAVRAGPGLRGVRPLVRLGADRDAAEPRVRPGRHQPGAHGRQHQDLHLPVHLRLADQGRGQLAGLRLRRAAADQGRLPRHQPGADASHFGLFTDFQAAAAAGTLPAFTFLEPSWSSTGNSQHPNYDVALGEQLIHDTYEALRSGPGWDQTLFVLTYDEHGGCYDHVPPPWGATPPDNTAGEFGFGFDRFGVRVPTLLISPLIAPGTVYRVPDGLDAARPHLHPQDGRAALEHARADRPRRRRARLRRRAHAERAAHRRRARRASPSRSPAAPGPSAGQVSHLEAIRDELYARYASRAARRSPPRSPPRRRRRPGPGRAPGRITRRLRTAHEGADGEGLRAAAPFGRSFIGSRTEAAPPACPRDRSPGAPRSPLWNADGKARQARRPPPRIMRAGRAALVASRQTTTSVARLRRRASGWRRAAPLPLPAEADGGLLDEPDEAAGPVPPVQRRRLLGRPGGARLAAATRPTARGRAAGPGWNVTRDVEVLRPAAHRVPDLGRGPGAGRVAALVLQGQRSARPRACARAGWRCPAGRPGRASRRAAPRPGPPRARG